MAQVVVGQVAQVVVGQVAQVEVGLVAVGLVAVELVAYVGVVPFNFGRPLLNFSLLTHLLRLLSNRSPTC